MNSIWHWVIVALLFVMMCIFLDRFVNPWQAGKRIKKLKKEIGQEKIKPKIFDKSILLDKMGITISDKDSQRILWSEIVKVTAYKRDLLSVDLICVFLSRADETGLEIHEDLNNWNNFVTSLPTYLPGCKTSESWLVDVTFPAFKANPMELYSRLNSKLAVETT